MSQETLDRLNWDINNIQDGIQHRNRAGDTADIPELMKKLSAKKHLRDNAIVICKTDDDFDIICENSYR